MIESFVGEHKKEMPGLSIMDVVITSFVRLIS